MVGDSIKFIKDWLENPKYVEREKSVAQQETNMHISEYEELNEEPLDEHFEDWIL